METVDVVRLSKEDRELVARAEEARRNGYAPYSNFLVGAAVRDGEGRVFVGANLENASYGVTACAEVAALTAANTAGSRSITTIAVAGRGRDVAMPGLYATPCGRCRQMIFEASQVSGVDVKVIAVGQDGTSARVTTIGRLLPEAFGPADLGLVASPTEKTASRS